MSLGQETEPNSKSYSALQLRAVQQQCETPRQGYQLGLRRREVGGPAVSALTESAVHPVEPERLAA